MSETMPEPARLWEQAGGDPERYRALMREHGLLLSPGDPGYDEAPKTLPCGWPGPARQPDPPGEECMHLMLRRDCDYCSPRRAAEPAADRESRGPWIEARYPGRCSAGDEHIRPGEQIRSDGEGGWLCARCGDDDA